MAMTVQERQRKFNASRDRVDIRLPMGTKDRIRELGYSSVQAFVTEAALQRLEKEENETK